MQSLGCPYNTLCLEIFQTNQSTIKVTGNALLKLTNDDLASNYSPCYLEESRVRDYQELKSDLDRDTYSSRRR